MRCSESAGSKIVDGDNGMPMVSHSNSRSLIPASSITVHCGFDPNCATFLTLCDHSVFAQSHRRLYVQLTKRPPAVPSCPFLACRLKSMSEGPSAQVQGRCEPSLLVLSSLDMGHGAFSGLTKSLSSHAGRL